MSMNRTGVQVVPIQTITGTEARDLLLNPLLLRVEAIEVLLPGGERAQVVREQRAYSDTAFFRPDLCGAIHVVWHGQRDVFHVNTRYHTPILRCGWIASKAASGEKRRAGGRE